METVNIHRKVTDSMVKMIQCSTVCRQFRLSGTEGSIKSMSWLAEVASYTVAGNIDEN